VKSIAAVLRPPVDAGRKPRAADTDAEWLAMKPVQQPDAAHRQIRFDFVTSIWCGAIVGCIGAVVMAPQSPR
jgi:hypothetical protein